MSVATDYDSRCATKSGSKEHVIIRIFTHRFAQYCRLHESPSPYRQMESRAWVDAGVLVL